MSAERIPGVDTGKVNARVHEFIQRCFDRPLLVGEHHSLTLKLTREIGGFVWTSEEELQSKEQER